MKFCAGVAEATSECATFQLGCFSSSQQLFRSKQLLGVPKEEKLAKLSMVPGFFVSLYIFLFLSFEQNRVHGKLASFQVLPILCRSTFSLCVHCIGTISPTNHNNCLVNKETLTCIEICSISGCHCINMNIFPHPHPLSYVPIKRTLKCFILPLVTTFGCGSPSC